MLRTKMAIIKSRKFSSYNKAAFFVIIIVDVNLLCAYSALCVCLCR
jgi:hypothetical protein